MYVCHMLLFHGCDYSFEIRASSLNGFGFSKLHKKLSGGTDWLFFCSISKGSCNSGCCLMSFYISRIIELVIRYVKFDTFTPAAERGLPVTRVISRMTLQQILARAVGSDIIFNESNVMDFVDDGEKVFIFLEALSG